MLIIPETVRRRKRLFRKSKPLIRPLTEADLWVLWAAYNEGSFTKFEAGLDKDNFIQQMLASLVTNSSTLLVEDDNKRFKTHRGPVCLIEVKTDDRRIEPKFTYFQWATKINVLRTSVRFFNWVRYNRLVAVCVVRCLADMSNLYHHVRKYGVLNFVGKIPGGDPHGRGDEHLFSIRGKWGVDGTSISAGATAGRSTKPAAASASAEPTAGRSTEPTAGRV